MENKEWTHVILVSCMYFSMVCTNGVAVGYYTNKWLVHVPYGEVAARKVAFSQNLTYIGLDLPYRGYHYMMKNDMPSKSIEHKDDITNGLKYHELVSNAFQDAVLPWSYSDQIYPSYVVPRTQHNYSLKSNYRKAFNDKKWSHMWYTQDFRTEDQQPVLDMNVVPVYYELGINGKGVDIAVIDGGIERDHPEISENLNLDTSLSFTDDNGDYILLGGHGTSSAGIIIMKQNNGFCGVGIAYGAMIGDINLLGTDMLTQKTTKSLTHGLEYVDIYSNSWGNPTEGNYLQPLQDLIKLAFSKGIKQGRGGKGVVYVFAVGNGKDNGDNCAYDHYINTIHTIGIAACDDSGHPTYYSERCAAVMATAYTGIGHERNVVTADLNGKCTNKFTGTSAATPIASGVIALAYSANSNLTWRDILHLLAWTSQVAPLSDNLGWNRNRAGFYYSVDFGFGLINAYKLVKKALIWKNVPKMKSCGVRLSNVEDFIVSRNAGARIVVKSTGCEGLRDEVNFIEQVQLMVTMTYKKRGDIQIAMTSPAGTEVHVLESRFKDLSKQGLKRVEFIVLAFWGESPKGEFVIDIYDQTGLSTNKGKILEIALVIHGTKIIPKAYSKGPRPYDDFQLASWGDSATFLQLSSVRNKYIQELKKRREKTNDHVDDQQNIDDSTYQDYQTYYQYIQNYNALYYNGVQNIY